jgi:hypothetical protein
MVINRSEVNATLITMGGQDEYGQDLNAPISQSSITLTFGLYTHQQTDDIRYQDVEYTGLTVYDVADNQVIQIGDKKYKVLFVNPFGRMKQVFLKK